MIRYREYGESHWEVLHTRRGRLFLPTPRLSCRDLWNPTDEEVARAIRSIPPHFAGNIQEKYGTISTFTVTNLQSLASSSTFQSGWGSAYEDNTTNLNINGVVYGQITAGTTPTAGSVRAYTYAYDGTNAQTFSSAGTPGTEGTLTITDSEQLDAFLTLLWESDVDTTTNDVYTMPPRSIRQAFGFMPRKYAVYIAHNTVATLKSSGNAMYADYELNQYT